MLEPPPGARSGPPPSIPGKGIFSTKILAGLEVPVRAFLSSTGTSLGPIVMVELKAGGMGQLSEGGCQMDPYSEMMAVRCDH